MNKFCKMLLAAAAITALAAPAMAGSPKLQVKDSGGNTKFVVNDDGTTGIGVSSTIYPVQIDSAIATLVPAGVGAFMMEGSTNKERFEVRSWGVPFGQGPVFQGKGGGWNTTTNQPSQTLAEHNLFMLGGSGHNGTSLITGNRALIKIKAPADWSATSNPTLIAFEATPVNSTTRTEYMTVSGDGVIVSNGPLRLNQTVTQPACSATTRGAFWVTQGAAGVKDVVAVCAKDAANAYAWRTLY